MRLFIDLQFCQNADITLTRDALSLAQQLARTADQHQVWIAFSNQFPARLEMLRAMFRDLVPAAQIVVYDTPAPDGTDRLQRMIEAIRDNFFLCLNADIVFAPQLFARAADTVGACRAGCGFLTAVSITDADLAAHADHAGQAAQAGLVRETAVLHPRHHASLHAADVVLVTSATVADAVHTAFGRDEQAVADVGNDPVASVQKIWLVFERLWRERPRAALAGRQRLAYVSPLPPQRSGIADYSAELVAALAHYYDIELVVEKELEFPPALTDNFPIRLVGWFEQNAHLFDRVLYHFGNSDVHQFMFDLLERHPGMIVLHDFFLSNVIDNMENNANVPLAFHKALFHSHGYTGLVDQARLGRNPAIWKYPANKLLLDAATGVIVHSQYAAQLADHWYGPGTSARWKTVPLLRSVSGDALPGREQARAELGIADDVFLICSFGMVGSAKLNDRLLAAFVEQAAGAGRCQLVFVGEDDPSAFGIALRDQIVTAGATNVVSITGFVSAERYRCYLQAADLAVQLRGLSRGETSASVLDCLLYGVATIINANGSNAELPDTVVEKLPDEFSQAELGAAIKHLREQAGKRLELAERGRQYVREHHAPDAVSKLYVEAIEQCTSTGPTAHYRQLLRAMVELGAPSDPRHYELVAAAQAIAANQPVRGPRQLFVDISAVVQSDLKTGIQRVVRSILQSLISDPPPGFRIEPVYGNGGNRRYRYARQFTANLIGASLPDLEDAPVDHRAGDIFLGLDLAAGCTGQNQAVFDDMRHHGVQVFFVVYDILPLLQPAAFPFGTEAHFREYILTIARMADGLVCISRAVADELSDWLIAHAAPRQAPLDIGFFHLGADIAASVPSVGLPDNAEAVMCAVTALPTILMVGTLEPRKGHAQALEAFDLLWRRGVKVNLVIVGKEGWMVAPLAKQLSNHPERGHRLFWLPGVSDEMLTKLYESSSALLAASVGEGFGLPLIEAAQHELPIIARNLPVFREVSGEHAFYFDGTSGEELAAAIETWLTLHADSRAPASSAMPWLSWARSAQQLMVSVVDQQWYRQLPSRRSFR
jgi:glycosyltransferase involved in cell wall biosynthesis